jgi:hypothetical protein
MKNLPSGCEPKAIGFVQGNYYCISPVISGTDKRETINGNPLKYN